MQPSTTHQEICAIIIERLGLKCQPIVDERLNEIDYGEWTGRSDQEIIDQFGADELKQWSEYSQWPKTGSWGGSEAQIRSDIQSFVSDLQKHSANDTIMVVSSNGRLRYFLTLIGDEFEKRRQNKTLKVKTGHLCELQSNNGNFALNYWDKNPGTK